jgi:hypothetical protein
MSGSEAEGGEGILSSTVTATRSLETTSYDVEDERERERLSQPSLNFYN